MPFAGLDLTFLGMRLSGAIHKRNGHGTNGHFYLEKILVQVRIRRCMTRRKSGFFDSVIHKKSPFGSPFFVISYSKVFGIIGLFGRCKPVFLAWLDDFEVSIVTCLTHASRRELTNRKATRPFNHRSALKDKEKVVPLAQDSALLILKEPREISSKESSESGHSEMT